jgi:alpha-glucosidase
MTSTGGGAGGNTGTGRGGTGGTGGTGTAGAGAGGRSVSTGGSSSGGTAGTGTGGATTGRGGASTGGATAVGGRDGGQSPDGSAPDMGPAPPNTVVSPNGRVAAEISTTGGVLRYRITVDGKQVLAPSEVGIRADGVDIGSNATLGTFAIKAIDETYDLSGNHAVAVNKANEAAVPVTGGSESYTLDVHVADDGVGVRLRLAAKKGRKIEAERSAWRFEGNPTVWVAGQDNSYEQTFKTTTLNALSGNYSLPLTAKLDAVYVTIAEATVKDYGDMALKASGGVLQGYLYADSSGWTTDAAVVQPWRVTIIADDLNGLVNTTLVQNLNPPRDASLANADWIKPGRSTWQWLTADAPKYAEQQQWVDWTQQLGFEYYLIDDGWQSWSDPWNNLKSVVTYATSKGVKIWVWVRSNSVTDAAGRQSYFKQVVGAGAVGVKIDFPPACNHTTATWYWDSAKDAAQAKLLLDFHGASKPDGMERTWPNVLTREAIRGHEYHIARLSRTLEAQHDVILPFTRYVIGAADYTPTDFASKDLQGNTWPHEMAQAILFMSPFLCYGGNPQDFVANTSVDVLKAIPAVWDQTIVLPGSEPGKVAAEARKSGNAWFVGILNGATATTMNLSLSFLGTGTWQKIQLGDAAQAGAWDRQTGTATAADSISVKLSSRGGFVAWFKQ